jgi:hypothetical protein
VVDKRKIRQRIGWLQRVKTWQLVLLLIVVSLVAATFLRLNNIGMIERRTAVFNADKAGNVEVTQARLFDLQRYSSAHMNADSGVVYLEEQSRRDTEAAIQSSSANNATDNINRQADATCKAQFGGYSQAYVQCFASELAKVPSGSATSQKAELPSASLYRHEFTSPLWSPDFAGFSLFVCVFLAVVIVVRLLGLALLRVLLHRHYSQA